VPRSGGPGAVGGDQPVAQLHQQQADQRLQHTLADSPGDECDQDSGPAFRVRQHGFEAAGHQHRHGPEQHDLPEVRADQVGAAAQPGQRRPALDLDHRPDHGEQGERDQPRDDQGHEPEHHDERDQQVSRDQRTPGQRAEHGADPGLADAAVGADQAAEEPGQEHGAEQADPGRAQPAGQRHGQRGVLGQVVDDDLHQGDHLAHRDRDEQDPPGVPPAGAQRGHRDVPGRQRCIRDRLAPMPPLTARCHGTQRYVRTPMLNATGWPVPPAGPAPPGRAGGAAGST